MTIVGSNCALEFSAFKDGWQRLQGWCDATRKHLSAAGTPSRAASAFTHLAHLRALAIVTCFAGRGTRLERLTWYALYSTTSLIFVIDKRDDAYSDRRAVPVHSLLREQLDAWLVDLDMLIAACRRLGLKVDAGGRRIDARSPSRTALFACHLGTFRELPVMRRSRLVQRRLEKLAQSCFGIDKLNVGRHTLISQAVLLGWDPWSLKMLKGHHRGYAEPFADGGMVSPRHGLADLRERLETLLSPLVTTVAPPQKRWVLAIEELPAVLPAVVKPAPGVSGTPPRVLPAPWQALTPSALRVIDFLRHRIAAIDGPSHAGAQVLVSMLLLDFMPLSDVEALWRTARPVRKLGSTSVAIWHRSARAKELHRPLDDRTAFAAGRALDDNGSLPHWIASRDHAAEWLRSSLPNFRWPESPRACLGAIDVMALMWQRHELPPYLLAAASPRLPAAAATRRSLLRLHRADREIPADEVLIAPEPIVRGPNRARVSESPLKAVLDRVHHWGSPVKRLGEDDARWSGLTAEVAKIAVDSDNRAVALAKVIEYEHEHWLLPGKRNPRRTYARRIEVASFSTYCYSIGSGFDLILPSEDLDGWEEEWIDWVDGILRSSLATKGRSIEEVRKSRMDATRHLLRSLRAVGYEIPDEALEIGRRDRIDERSRRAASATVLLSDDRRRIGRIIDQHYARSGLGRMLANLYAQLCFEAPMRACELAALEIDALSEFGDLSIHAVGFSHVKSPSSWRLQPLGQECAHQFRSVAQFLREASPKTRWLFLDAEEDRAWANQMSSAFGVAIRQVTAEVDARQHASRAVAPLDKILPGWEEVAGGVVRGDAGVDRCREFVALTEKLGVAHLVRQIVSVGHSHPGTYLKYYFAIWPWVLAVYARALNASLAHPDEVARRLLGSARAGYRKAKQRSGAGFDGWAWMRRHACASMIVLTAEDAPDHLGVQATPRKELVLAGPSRRDCGAGVRAVRYVAGRFMGLSEIAAAHLFGLDSKRAASLEATMDVASGQSLRRREQGTSQDRGRQAELHLLRGDLGLSIAERFKAARRDDVGLIVHWISPSRRAHPHSVMPIDALTDELRSCAALLPRNLAVLVQLGAHRYTADELARLAKLSGRIVVDAPHRDVANRPRVRIVDALEPHNRVRRARLTALVRCLSEAALIVHDTGIDP